MSGSTILYETKAGLVWETLVQQSTTSKLSYFCAGNIWMIDCLHSLFVWIHTTKQRVKTCLFLCLYRLVEGPASCSLWQRPFGHLDKWTLTPHLYYLHAFISHACRYFSVLSLSLIASQTGEPLTNLYTKWKTNRVLEMSGNLYLTRITTVLDGYANTQWVNGGEKLILTWPPPPQKKCRT